MHLHTASASRRRTALVLGLFAHSAPRHPAYPTEIAYVELKKWTSVSPWKRVLPVAKLKEADQRIADRYQITQRHSSHFEDVHTGL